MSSPDDPRRDDTFDHFFARPAGPAPRADDSDATHAFDPRQGAGAAPSSEQQTHEIRYAGPAGEQPAPGHYVQPGAPMPARSFDELAERSAAASPDRKSRSGLAAPLVIIVVSLVVLAGVLGWVLLRDNSHTIPAATGSVNGVPATAATQTPSATGSASGSSSTSSSPSSDTSSSSSSSAAFPAGASACAGTTQYEVGVHVSCPFAANVVAKYQAATKGSDGSAQITAYSPVTKQSYPLTCSGAGVITCTDGDIYVYLQAG